MAIYRVQLSASAQKSLRKIPLFISDKLLAWVKLVGSIGLEEARKIPSYHDEPLRGHRLGQRSIRLSRSYRAIYVIDRSGIIEFVSVEEVNKHDYR